MLHGEVLGNEHPQTLSSLSGMAQSLDALGKHEDALQICHEHSATKTILPKAAVNRIAAVFERSGQPEKAETLKKQPTR